MMVFDIYLFSSENIGRKSAEPEMDFFNKNTQTSASHMIDKKDTKRSLKKEYIKYQSNRLLLSDVHCLLELEGSH
jgi:hypothetical protein